MLLRGGALIRRAARRRDLAWVRAFSTPTAMDDDGIEYLVAWRTAMAELAHLGVLPGTASQSKLGEHKPFFDAVVLPLRRAYAWGVPNEAALQAIVDVSPRGVVEIGAGTGYWAHLLMKRGCSVRAFDAAPMQESDLNGFHALAHSGNALPFTRVHRGGAEAAALHPERTLLLCWPPRESDGSGTGERDVAMMAQDALAHYSGGMVAYVGVCRAAAAVRDGGAAEGGPAAAEEERYDTAGAAFETALCDEFEMTRQIALPNWPPLHDSLTLWRRKPGAAAGDAARPAAAVLPAESPHTPRTDAEAADGVAEARRARARLACLDEIRWAGFDRSQALETLMRWTRRRRAGLAAAGSPEEVQLLRRGLERAPWALRLLGRAVAQRLEHTF